MRSRSDFAVLGLLADEPRSGYDIKKAVEERLSHFWHESFGNLYPTLRRLRAEGLVEKHAAGRDGRKRFVYAITSAGREALAGWFGAPLEPMPPRQELLLKVFLGRHATPQDLVRQVEDYRAHRAATAGQLAGLRAFLQQEAADHPDLFFWDLTLRAGLRAAEAAVAWCDETLPLLRDRTEST